MVDNSLQNNTMLQSNDVLHKFAKSRNTQSIHGVNRLISIGTDIGHCGDWCLRTNAIMNGDMPIKI